MEKNGNKTNAPVKGEDFNEEPTAPIADKPLSDKTVKMTIPRGGHDTEVMEIEVPIEWVENYKADGWKVA